MWLTNMQIPRGIIVSSSQFLPEPGNYFAIYTGSDQESTTNYWIINTEWIYEQDLSVENRFNKENGSFASERWVFLSDLLLKYLGMWFVC